MREVHQWSFLITSLTFRNFLGLIYPLTSAVPRTFRGVTRGRDSLSLAWEVVAHLNLRHLFLRVEKQDRGSRLGQ